MSFKSLILSRLIAARLSPGQRLRAHGRNEKARKAAGKPHEIRYFHQADDPYSHVMAQALAQLAIDFDVTVLPHLVPPPNADTAPEATLLRDHALRDATLLAAKAGFHFPIGAVLPSPSRARQAAAALNAAQKTGSFLAQAADIGTALWSGAPLPKASETDLDQALEQGQTLLHKNGHYMGSTAFYGREWYWGVDRLHYLTTRLAALGAARGPSAPSFCPALTGPTAPPNGAAPAIDFFFSFRSPYSYLAFERTCALADAYNAPLNLRFVLPMVMRGLPVPPTKRLYIAHDAAREAARLGIPFGRIADPLGVGVERGYALLPWAISMNQGRAYCLSFMRNVWSQGVDAATTRGLRRIVTDAGLDWSQAQQYLTDPSWRTLAEDNRLALENHGLWGVPSYAINDQVFWGQDRLWAVQDVLEAERTS